MLRFLSRLLIICLLNLVPLTARAAEPVSVFAAASLTDAMQELLERFHKDTGIGTRLALASSSTLARQIEAGAPAAIYASANSRWMDYLEERDLLVPDSRKVPIRNSLVVIAPAGREQAIPEQPAAALLATLGPREHLAVGDPDHVPAGIYARQSLISLGLWNGIRNRLARADNVRAALALVASGEAPLGIVYSTDAAISGDIRIAGRLPAESHRPITYPFALIRGQDTPAARQLLDWLTGPEAQKTYRAYGFNTDGTE